MPREVRRVAARERGAVQRALERPGLGSEVNVNCGLVSSLVGAGPSVIVVFGAAVSRDERPGDGRRVAGRRRSPATSNVCDPSAVTVGVCRRRQVANVPRVDPALDRRVRVRGEDEGRRRVVGAGGRAARDRHGRRGGVDRDASGSRACCRCCRPASTARTLERVRARGERRRRERVRARACAPRRRPSTGSVTGDSLEEKPHVGVVSLVAPDGPLTIVVSGRSCRPGTCAWWARSGCRRRRSARTL